MNPNEHILENSWTFYYQDKELVATDYANSICKIAHVRTVEEFWRIYSHLVKPGAAPSVPPLHFFRGNGRAMWEDPENKNGGTFRLFFRGGMIKFYWEQLLIALIGERLHPDVLGIVASTSSKGRMADLLTIWHATSSSDEIRMTICKELQDILELPLKTSIEYRAFTSFDQSKFIRYIIEESDVREEIITKKDKTG